MSIPDYLAVSRLFAALSRDIVAWDLRLLDHLARDTSVLELKTIELGLTFPMVDMPNACRVIDKALSSGHLSSSKLPSSFLVAGEGTPFFLGCLIDMLFDQHGYLSPNVDSTAIYFLRQALCLFKKVKIESPADAVLAEVSAFRKIDSGLRKPTFEWDSDDLGFQPDRVSLTDGYRSQSDLVSRRDDCPLPLLLAAEAASDIAFGQFPVCDPGTIRPRHGPGAVADARFGTDKYLFPSWPVKLDRIFPFELFTQSREDMHLEEPSHVGFCDVEPPARLIAVPKTLKAPRMIASEPIAHQYVQLGMMRWMRDNMPSSISCSIDFRDQVPSQDMCLEASRTGRYATVDLSAASDHLSCWLVERMARRNPSLLTALHACRTRWVTNATGVGDSFTMALRKLGAMGAGTTFPMQTICYTILAIAAIMYERGYRITAKNMRKTSEEVRVFGDDIILPSSAVWSLVLLMTHLGLKVNPVKTHWEGRFRESCGIDAYGGIDVTPLYLSSLSLESNAESLSAWVDVSNNAHQKGLWHLSAEMLAAVPHGTRSLLPVSSWPLGCLSLLTFVTGLSHSKRRYNRNLHRDELRGLTPVSKVKRSKREDSTNLLQYFVEEPAPDSNWESGFSTTKRSLLKERWVPVYGVDKRQTR